MISFKFFVCFIFNVSLGSAPKRKNFDIQCNTRVASGGQFTLNYHTPSHNFLLRSSWFWTLLVMNWFWIQKWQNSREIPSLLQWLLQRRLLVSIISIVWPGWNICVEIFGKYILLCVNLLYDFQWNVWWVAEWGAWALSWVGILHISAQFMKKNCIGNYKENSSTKKTVFLRCRL